MESAARMEAEAAALRRLTHNCIVRVPDSGTAEDGSILIVTELVEGCDLHRLPQAGQLPPERALHIAHCAARALEHAHGCGIIHRDVKPANILTGRDGAVKLGDFSLARVDGGYSFQFRRVFRRFEGPSRRQAECGFRPVLVKPPASDGTAPVETPFT